METIKTFIAWPYKIEVNIALKDKDGKPCQNVLTDKIKKPVFSVSALIYKDGTCEEAGQCRETINEILKEHNAETMERAKINYLRENYHLNDLHAGTPKQEGRLKEHADLLKVLNISGTTSDYVNSCTLLKKADLYNDEGREYGGGWKYWEIPAKDLTEIKKLFY